MDINFILFDKNIDEIIIFLNLEYFKNDKKIFKNQDKKYLKFLIKNL